MNIPLSPPTDSLYKFMALSGLLLVGFSLAISFSAIRQQHDNLNKYLADLKNFQMDVEARWVSLLPGRSPTTAPYSDVSEAEWRHRRVLMETAAASIEDERRAVNVLQGLCAMGAIVGTAASASGFALWRVHIQKPQDELLAIQVRKARLEASRLDAATDPINDAGGAGESSQGAEHGSGSV